MRSTLNRITPLFILLISFTTGFSQRQVVEKIVAKVDEQIILLSDVKTTELEFRRVNPIQVDNIECEVLKTLVFNKFLLAKAETDSVTIADEQIDQQLDMRMRQILMAYGGDESTLIEQYGKTINELKLELRPRLKDQLLIQRMQEVITRNVKISPSEVEDFYNNIPKDSLPFFSAEYEIAQIVLYPTATAQDIQNLKDQMLRMKIKIEKGERTFEELARRWSLDPGSASQGGDLGFQTKGTFVPEFEAAVAELQPGQISEPIKSQFGYHMIQLIERRGSQAHTRHILMNPDLSGADLGALSKRLDSIKTQVSIDSISFFKAAYTFSHDEESKSKGGRITDASGNSKVAGNQTDIIGPDLYFVVDAMKNGDMSSPIVFKNSKGEKGVRVVLLISKTKGHLANLKDDYQKISNAALNQKKVLVQDEWFENNAEDVYIQIDPAYDYCDIKLIE